MTITIIQSAMHKSKQRGHSNALPCPNLNQPGRLRIGHLMTVYNLSHSSIYVHIDKGLIPPADGKIARRQYWRVETIRNDLAK
jgi:hypothetical protein